MTFYSRFVVATLTPLLMIPIACLVRSNHLCCLRLRTCPESADLLCLLAVFHWSAHRIAIGAVFGSLRWGFNPL